MLDPIPATFGQPQRAADREPDLFRGPGVHAADTVIDHGRVGELIIRAASIRGTYGRYNGTPREDDYAMGRSDDGRWLILAVADGLTSASASHLAATLAVRTAIQQSQRMISDGIENLDLQGVFQSAAYQLRRGAEPLLQRQGRDPTPESIRELFATTLLVAVIPTHGQGLTPVQLARVGDSNAWLVSADGWHPIFDAKDTDGGMTSSAVHALPALPDAVTQRTVAVVTGQTLVLASDGVTDPFGADGEGEVARYLQASWAQGLPPPLEFARQISFRGQSWDDDRTAIAVAGIR